jgi:hypothetical protein
MNENLTSVRPMKATSFGGTRRLNQRFSLRGFFQGVSILSAVMDHFCVPPGVYGKPYAIYVI